MKKGLYVIGAIILILIITNPSVKAFKDYLGHGNEGGLSRQANFFIFSIYLNWGNSAEYFGIAGNFYQINNKPTRATQDNAHPIDTKMATHELPSGYTPVD